MNKVIQPAGIQWDKKGLPHSVQFGDKYFCEENGLAESKYIFCGGNQLEERWRLLPKDQPGTFIIAETGFGSGLNFLCAWQLWQECAPTNWRLHYMSIDQYPLSVEDLSRALALWPVLNAYAPLLVEQYAAMANNTCPDFYFEKKNIKVTLILEHVVAALDRLKKEERLVDAWFLDGFAPANNPDMWSEDVFARLAALSQSQTTLSTFTVAGMVRRGLACQGFVVEKVKGFGRKRHMLRGYWP